MMLPSRDQLIAAMRELDTAAIRGKLASGELTEIAQAVATEELSRRDQEDDECIQPRYGPVDDFDLGHASINFLKQPLGWGWMNWMVLLLICAPIVMSFGVSAKQKAEDRKSTRLNSSHG